MPLSLAVLRKRNASIKKYHKNAKINCMKAQEKLYGNAWQKCTKAHYYLMPLPLCLTQVTENETVIAD